MMKILTVFLQVLFLIAIAPLVSGIIRKIKNNIRMRKGAGIFQPYFNLFKLFSKEEVVSETASWIFKFAPFIVLSSVITALLIVPVMVPGWSLAYMGDFLVIIFLLALGRFFLALAGLDTGSAFGGMGSSREMFISSLVEPVALLAVFTVSIKSGSTNLDIISSSQILHISTIIAGVSLFLVTIGETSRLPIDNQETHLELTMVHEAMVLEYSGRSLGLIELASHIKQILFFTLVVNILFPAGLINNYNYYSLAGGIVIYLLKILGISVIVSIIEVSVAKMRLFRVVDFFAFGFVLASMAIIIASMGF
jgi:formate hydrogenlyase subunit 4